MRCVAVLSLATAAAAFSGVTSGVLPTSALRLRSASAVTSLRARDCVFDQVTASAPVISAISPKPGCGALSARPYQATILQLVQQLSLTEQSCSTGALRGLRRMPRQQSILR